MNFGKALEELKEGNKVARSGWNGKGMFIYLTSESIIPTTSLKEETKKHIFGDKDFLTSYIKINAHIDMKAVDGSITTGWNPSQVDMLAEDWEIVK